MNRLLSNRTLLFAMAFCFLAYIALRYLLSTTSLAHPAFQLAISKCILLLAILLLVKNYWKGQNVFTRSESPYTLSALRLAVFALPAWFAILPYHQLSDTILRQWVDLPDTDRVALPWLSYYSLHVPVSRYIISLIQPVFLLVSITSFIGLFTRASTIIYAILAFYIYSICHLFGKPVNNHYLLWFPIVLSCADCGRVLSVDALITRLRTGAWPNDARSNAYTPAINASLILLGILYFFPGFWKIWTCGLDWIFRYNLRNIFYTKWLELNHWLPVIRIDQSDTIIVLVSLFTVLFELVFVFWALARKHSWLLLAGGVAFHYSILYFTQINFTFLLPVYVCLFDWGKVVEWLRKKTNKGGPPVAVQIPATYSFSRLVLIVLVSGNILFGFLKVVSWPFACFPAFDYMVPEKIAVIYYEGYSNGKFAANDSTFRKYLNSTFSSYNVAARENRIISFYSQGQSGPMFAGIQSLLRPVKDSVVTDSILVYKILRPLNPGTDLTKVEKETLAIIKPEHFNEK